MERTSNSGLTDRPANGNGRRRKRQDGGATLVDVERRLRACGVRWSTCVRWRPELPGHVWRAETALGARYVVWDGAAWFMMREPPCSHR